MIKHIHAKHYQPIKCYFIHFLTVCYAKSKNNSHLCSVLRFLNFIRDNRKQTFCLTTAKSI